MIIFDLDGTLADCSHRRKYVNPKLADNAEFRYTDIDDSGNQLSSKGKYFFKGQDKVWQPNWRKFFDACDKDTPIMPVVSIFQDLLHNSCHTDGFPDREIVIWSGRCESVRTQTENWLDAECDLWKYVDLEKHKNYQHILKMRPIGDLTPDHELKERWLDQAIKEGKTIEMVFDDRPKVVRLWRKRGIFVFNCLQHDGEF